MPPRQIVISQLHGILSHVVDGIEIMVCGGGEQINALMGGGQPPRRLRTVIYMEQPSTEVINQLRDFGMAVYSFGEIEVSGTTLPPFQPP